MPTACLAGHRSSRPFSATRGPSDGWAGGEGEGRITNDVHLRRPCLEGN